MDKKIEALLINIKTGCVLKVDHGLIKDQASRALELLWQAEKFEPGAKQPKTNSWLYHHHLYLSQEEVKLLFDRLETEIQELNVRLNEFRALNEGDNAVVVVEQLEAEIKRLRAELAFKK